MRVFLQENAVFLRHWGLPQVYRCLGPRI